MADCKYYDLVCITKLTRKRQSFPARAFRARKASLHSFLSVDAPKNNSSWARTIGTFPKSVFFEPFKELYPSFPGFLAYLHNNMKETMFQHEISEQLSLAESYNARCLYHNVCILYHHTLELCECSTHTRASILSPASHVSHYHICEVARRMLEILFETKYSLAP